MIKRMQAEQRKFVDKVWEERSKDIAHQVQGRTDHPGVHRREGDGQGRRAAARGRRVPQPPEERACGCNPIPPSCTGSPWARGRWATRRPAPSAIRLRLTTPTPFPGCRRDRSPIRDARPSRPCCIPPRPSNLYFVADGTGGHVFADTNAEHNANVEKWREIEKRMRAEQDASGERQPSRRRRRRRSRQFRPSRSGREAGSGRARRASSPKFPTASGERAAATTAADRAPSQAPASALSASPRDQLCTPLSSSATEDVVDRAPASAPSVMFFTVRRDSLAVGH